MSLPLQNMSSELRRAWVHALFNALNRDAKELAVADVLVGLHEEFGELALRYFEPESAAVELVVQIRGSATAHTYSLSNLSELGQQDHEGGGREFFFRRRCLQV